MPSCPGLKDKNDVFADETMLHSRPVHLDDLSSNQFEPAVLSRHLQELGGCHSNSCCHVSEPREILSESFSRTESILREREPHVYQTHAEQAEADHRIHLEEGGVDSGEVVGPDQPVFVGQ